MDTPKNSSDMNARGTLAQHQTWRLPTHVGSDVVVLVDPGSPAARDAVSIASKLQHMHIDNGVRSFCIIGDDHSIGTTVVSANIASAFALSGLRTVLVETNFRSPSLASLFGLETSRPGLSDWLADIGDSSAWAAYLQPVYPGLAIMPAGNTINEGEAYLATQLRQLIIEMSRMFDVVVCDAAPMNDISATVAVVSAVERTILVARANKTRMKSLFDFQEVVTKCGGVIGGSVYLEF